MAFYCTDPRLGVPLMIAYGVSTDFPADSIQPKIGTVVSAVDPHYGPGEFIWAYGVAANAIGKVATINPRTGVTVLTVAAGRGALTGVSTVTNTSTTTAQWWQISGVAYTDVAAAFADGGLVYATATAGVVDDAVVAGDQVTGAIGASAIDYAPGAKTCSTTNGNDIIVVPNIDGLVVGMGVSGTGIAGGTTISAIGYGGVFPPVAGPLAGTVKLSAVATATGSASLTFTGTGYALVNLNRPMMNGLG